MKIPKTIYNWLSVIGFILVINSILLILVLFLFSVFTPHTNIYNGVFTYIILPVILVIGLLLIPIGMMVKRRKRKTGMQRWPVLDLNVPHSRQWLVMISIFTFLFLIISAMGSYEAFNYTESVEFCGKLCHKVMAPEYITYQNSPHARVRCVECHVGEGASWYVKSKLSGMYQVYSVLFHKYPQPIPTPIKNLRPARETCERCHWPQKFYPRSLRTQRGYLTDSLNTEWNVSMLMKTGPTYSSMGLTEGIHWHINPNMKIEYMTSARDRESIPWVRYTNLKTGEVQIFQDTENMLSEKAKDTLEVRTMDCMDCHNRPSHSYKSAPVYIDNAMVRGSIPKELPFIKKVAMNVLKGPWSTSDSAMMYIHDSVTHFYKMNYPDIYRNSHDLIDQAIKGIEEEFSKNVFPEMKATSDKYLNHIGHLESDGCFRCHSDRHKSEKGKVISKNCNMCHTIIAQGTTKEMKYGSLGDVMGFIHPVDVKDKWQTNFCSECHQTLYP
ncbi:MAG: NapC/NirT family cytochrome c [Bacteroidetes bacterium]|nr:NapC/NirT family cytochrome c [Bacteroidota bacterium]